MALLYRVTNQFVPKLLIQGRYGYYIGPEARVSEQPDVSHCIRYILYIKGRNTEHMCSERFLEAIHVVA